MNSKNDSLNALHDIRNMMERSSRFISLSGLSGISAGLCALAGAGYARCILQDYAAHPYPVEQLRNKLLLLSAVVFVAAFVCAFFFTYLRGKKIGVPVWGVAARRMMTNVAIPFVAGGILVVRLLDLGYFELLGSVCLIVYGIALFCGSQQSTKEIRYLAFSELILGCISLWFLGHGLLFWSIGFGFLHILYGLIMWFRYERK